MLNKEENMKNRMKVIKNESKGFLENSCTMLEQLTKSFNSAELSDAGTDKAKKLKQQNKPHSY